MQNLIVKLLASLTLATLLTHSSWAQNQEDDYVYQYSWKAFDGAAYYRGRALFKGKELKFRTKEPRITLPVNVELEIKAISSQMMLIDTIRIRPTAKLSRKAKPTPPKPTPPPKKELQTEPEPKTEPEIKPEPKPRPLPLPIIEKENKPSRFDMSDFSLDLEIGLQSGLGVQSLDAVGGISAFSGTSALAETQLDVKTFFENALSSTVGLLLRGSGTNFQADKEGEEDQAKEKIFSNRLVIQAIFRLTPDKGTLFMQGLLRVSDPRMVVTDEQSAAVKLDAAQTSYWYLSLQQRIAIGSETFYLYGGIAPIALSGADSGSFWDTEFSWQKPLWRSFHLKAGLSYEKYSIDHSIGCTAEISDCSDGKVSSSKTMVTAGLIYRQ